MARATCWRSCGARGESQADWEGLLGDLCRRGLEGKQLGLIVTDGLLRFSGFRKIAVSGLKMMAGMEFARSYRSRYAEAVLRTLKPKWKLRFRRTSRVSCESILERRLPDKNGDWAETRNGGRGPLPVIICGESSAETCLI